MSVHAVRRTAAVRRWLLACGALLALAGCAEQLAAPTEPLRMLRPTWGEAYAGEAFDGALRATGGLRPYTFEVVAGSLPEGLELRSGRLFGTPTGVGRYVFTVQVSDGNLSQALQELELVVRPLPTPIVAVATPATEIRDAVTLVARVTDARGWRGAQVVVRWDAASFHLAEPPTATDGRMVVFSEAGDGVLRFDVAALGTARNGAFDVARWTLAPADPPARLSLSVVATSRYAGGDARSERREGAPPGAAPSDPAADAVDDAAAQDPTDVGTEEP